MRKATDSIDYTNRDYRAYRQMMVDKLKEVLPEYTDTSSTDAGIVILEGLANGLDICSYYTDTIANDVVLATTQDRSIATILARNLGYEPYVQTASTVPMVFTLNPVQETDTLIPRGTVVTTEENGVAEPVPFETLKDLVIPAGKTGDEKDSDGNYLYKVNAQQGETVNEDYLGSSNGNAYQMFQFTYQEALLDSIEVYVNEGNGETLWNRVNSFVDCNSTDHAYMVTFDEYDNCYIQFGNNIKGKIPAAYDNGIKAQYRTGGGLKGNVKENTVTVLETDITGVEGCFNLEPVIRGHEKEPLDSIKYNAPANNRTRDRAVTLQDFSDLIKINVAAHDTFYGILNTKTIRNPSNGLEAIIYYQMREGYSFGNQLLMELDSFFDQRIMIGTSYKFLQYEDYPVDLKVKAVIYSDYDLEEVTEEVKAFITEYFHYGNFTFGDEFMPTDIETATRNAIYGLKSLRVVSPAEDIITADNVYGIISLHSLTVDTSFS